MSFPFQQNGERGQAVLIGVLFFVTGSVAVLSAITSPILRETKTLSDWRGSRQSFYVGEGSVEEVTYRIINAVAVSSSETLSLLGTNVTTTVTDTSDGKQITAVGNNGNLVRKSEVLLSSGSGASFYYGLQTGAGGTNVANGTNIYGNIYTNGIVYMNEATIYGDVVSAGPGGYFSGHATGTVYAHTIANAQIGKDAYYQSISGSTVGGISYPGSADQPIVPVDTLAATVADWEASALAGGTISSCTNGVYTISSNTTLGPVKIACTLSVSNGVTITLLGNVWATGNILLSNNVIVRVDPSLSGNSVALIADNPADRINSSTITVSNNVSFYGSGSGSSSIVLVSKNNALSIDEDGTAINYSNNASGTEVVLFAPEGLVNVSNGGTISALTAYKANMSNNSQIRYKTGLTSTLFTSGPGGGYSIGSWKEVQ